MKSLRSAGKVTVIVVAGTLALAIPSDGAQKSRMQKVAAELVKAYNTMDSVGYRSLYSAKLLDQSTLAELGKDLRDSNDQIGKIVDFKLDVSSAGDRGLLVVRTESGVHDIHLRIDAYNKLVREVWLPHKEDPSKKTALPYKETAH